MLPKIPDEISNGGVYLQNVRCGKPNCRCANGERHEGYYYYIRREGTRIRKTYIPKRHVSEFSRLVAMAREARLLNRTIARLSKSTLKEMNSFLRENATRS